MALVATSADVDALLPGTSTAVGASLMARYLSLAAIASASSTIYGSNLATAQALRCLHMLARTGKLAGTTISDPGERGQVTGDSQPGGSSTSYVDPSPNPYPSDADLRSTRWGRLLLEIRRGARHRGSGALVG